MRITASTPPIKVSTIIQGRYSDRRGSPLPTPTPGISSIESTSPTRASASGSSATVKGSPPPGAATGPSNKKSQPSSKQSSSSGGGALSSGTIVGKIGSSGISSTGIHWSEMTLVVTPAAISKKPDLDERVSKTRYEPAPPDSGRLSIRRTPTGGTSNVRSSAPDAA